MVDYLVAWEIDISADSPREAAEIALAVMRDPKSRATVFQVHDDTGNYQQIDLEEPAP